jgi:hypothetical protein
MAFLPELYTASQPDSLLSKAVSAVAYANYAQRFGSDEARREAIKSCSEALRLMQSVMNNLDSAAIIDETLTSMSLLGYYEVRPICYVKTAHSLTIF